MLQFLQLVLPPASGGWFALASPGDNGMRFSKAQTHHALAAKALVLSGQQRDIFVVLAEFAEPRVAVNGKVGFKFQSNVKGIGSYFLDLDCGPEDHKYPDKKTALTEFGRWLALTRLPAPSVIVDSGGGIHVYWAVGRSVEPSEWLPRSQVLIASCRASSFKADPVVTIDHSRFLRLPGSFNHKHTPPRPCRVIAGTMAHVDEAAFNAALDALAQIVPAPRAPAGPGINDDLTSYNTVPASADQIIDRCEQMLWQWNTQGEQASEPEWFAALCLLAHTRDGEDLRHELSNRHPGYTVEKTDAKWEHARGSVGPTTCQRFESLRPELCQSCQWRGTITSPIQLGRDAVPAAAPVVQQLILGAPMAEPVAFGKFRVLPEKAIAVMAKSDEKGAPDYPRVFFRGALCLKHIINREGAGYRYIFALERRGEVSAEISLDGEALYNSTAFGRWLGNNHISVGLKDVATMQEFTTHYIKQLQASLPTSISYNGFGWREDASQFVIGNTLLRKGSDEFKAIMVNDRVNGVATHIQPAGDLGLWKSIVELFTRKDMPAHAFGFAAGFGAPLMEFLPEKGAVLSLISPGGSQGKTSVLRVQNSIYGDPDGPMLQPSDTVNARFHMTGILGNLPVTMDEVTNVEPRDLSDFLLNFTLGREKLRMKPDGSEIQTRHMANRWATILTCTSNSSLAEKLMLHRGNPHAENLRLFEASLVLPPSAGTLDARDLLQKLRANHGIAGLIYIRYLLDHLDDVRDMLLEESRRVVQEFEIPNYDRFATPLCAAIFVGATLANHLKLTTFDLPSMRVWAKSTYTGRVAEINNVANSAPHDVMLDIISELQQDQTQSIRNGKTVVTNVKTPLMSINHDRNTVAIVQRELRKRLQEKLMDYSVILNWLRGQGWLVGEEMVEFYYGVTGYSTPRKCLVISSAIIGKSRPQLAVNNDIAPLGKLV